ncbi:hypothetical protein RS030_203132 [Cryptosporidium xiaoi]|uniref:Small nuclear ribonucleoprotein Prp3 C-terminal domain-containing protein n=1 Tax=Cryptosporidium xiaoi TaxID=659607 RepID=A0AAV9XY28_9CRYT
MKECSGLNCKERLRLEIEALRCIFTEYSDEFILSDDFTSWIINKDECGSASEGSFTLRAKLDSRYFYSTQLFLKLTINTETHYDTGPIEFRVVSDEASVPFFLSDSQCSYIINEAKNAFVRDSECIYNQIIAAREATELIVKDLPPDNNYPCSNEHGGEVEEDDSDNHLSSDEELERDSKEGSIWSISNISNNGLHKTITWGMRACYSHHIRSKIKRKLICEWARELSLGGFCKIGYPGIIILEGPEECCLEYTRRLQRLRWKHFVVRGEIIDEISLIFNKEGKVDLDSMRKLPERMIELPPEQMKTLAKYCDELGIKDLFLTTMKIYSK